MVHLRPLPGTPLYAGSMQEVIDAALEDATQLDRGGIDAIMMENYGDVPFRRKAVEPHTIAAMALVAGELRRLTNKPLGINVLRNDPIAALAIAAVCGASMIRVNVHTGAMLTDQGIIQGEASGTLEYRKRLGSQAAILADVDVKHARPLAELPIEEAAADASERGLADALIVTGSRTGAATSHDDIERVRGATSIPVIVGSGVTGETIGGLLAICDGVIVGSWLKRNGDVRLPVDRERVERLMAVARGAGSR